MNKIKKCRKIDFVNTLAYYDKMGFYNPKLCISSSLLSAAIIYLQESGELADDDFVTFIRGICVSIVGYCIGTWILDQKYFKKSKIKIKNIEKELNEMGLDISFDKGHEFTLKRTNDIQSNIRFEDKVFECTMDEIIYKDANENVNDITKIVNKHLK